MTEPRKLQDRIAIAFGAGLPVAADSPAGSFAAIHDALGDIAVTRDLDGRILSANRTFRDVTGIDAPEGRTCDELGIVFRPARTPHALEVDFTGSGYRRAFVWQDVVVGGDAPVVQSIAREVTGERSRIEAIEADRRAAEDESQRKSRLIATVSHEIRTPLSGLLGMGQLLAGTELTPEQKNYLEGIRQSGTDLVHLVEDLLDFSTLAAGKFHLRPLSQPIRPLIEGVVEMLSSRAHAKGIEIAATVDPAVPEAIEFDAGRLRQVLYNVVGNAVKFTQAGGVSVDAIRTDAGLEVLVEDTGPGMNADELMRIFGEFEQGDLSRAREGGVGLGLAISARIMAEAGGGITVESTPGHGTTFIIRMPMAVTGPGMRTGSELSGADVLLLAPEGPAARGIALSLADLGAKVRRAVDIASARQQLSLHPINGVIVDHRLDKDFARDLARDAALRGARKIFLVNPESRPATMSGDIYDSWLIRPLREQSMIDVLTGKLRGLEARPAGRETFPVLAATADEDALLPRRLADAARIGTRVILAEDDPVNAMIVRAMLEKAGFVVRTVTSFERLAALHAEKPATIIVTDNTLDDGTCDRFVGALREREDAGRAAPTPVIVLTADGRQQTRRELLMRGANLVLVKPAKAEALVAAVIDLVARHAA